MRFVHFHLLTVFNYTLKHFIKYYTNSIDNIVYLYEILFVADYNVKALDAGNINGLKYQLIVKLYESVLRFLNRTSQ